MQFDCDSPTSSQGLLLYWGGDEYDERPWKRGCMIAVEFIVSRFDQGPQADFERF